MPRKRIHIIGGGVAGLRTACCLCTSHEVHIYEKGKSPGQKMLIAGKGGFNITNNLPKEEAVSKYAPPGFLDEALAGFDAWATRNWMAELGIPTFVGSSGRVFPEKGIKAIDVLRKIQDFLIENGTAIHLRHEFTGFDPSLNPVVRHGNEQSTLLADYTVFSMGGASWPSTGSNGNWKATFDSAGFGTKPFESSNCGIQIPWPESILFHHAGKPLKNIRLRVNGKESKGEALITDTGLEGNAVYPLVPEIRDLLRSRKEIRISLDFKPFNSREELVQKVSTHSVSPREYAQLFNLNPAQLAVIKAFSDKESYLSPLRFAGILKDLSLPVLSLRPVEESISTVGGVLTSGLNTDFSLKKHPAFFTIGEMVDWDAPTGGFLMQACFSMGNHVAKAIMKRAEQAV